MKRLGLIILVSGVFAFPVSAAELQDGENLLTPFTPSKMDWKIETAKDGVYESRVWTKKKSDERDSYAVSEIKDYREALAAFRHRQDAPGKDQCDAFDSELLNSERTNGYVRLLWRAHCRNDDGFEATILHVAIQGEDNLYHVQRIWRDPVDASEMAAWTRRLETVSVCDTRDEEHPCPVLLEPVS